MAGAQKEAVAGLVITCKGEEIKGAPKKGETYAVRPVAGGPREKAKGTDVVAELGAAFPGAHFLWLSKPVKAKGAKPEDRPGTADATPGAVGSGVTPENKGGK